MWNGLQVFENSMALRDIEKKEKKKKNIKRNQAWNIQGRNPVSYGRQTVNGVNETCSYNMQPLYYR